MKLSPRELDKVCSLWFNSDLQLVISQVGWLAQKRLANGIQLNQVEATALIAAQLHELVRTGTDGLLTTILTAGHYSVSQLMSEGKKMLGRRHVLVHGLSHAVLTLDIACCCHWSS
jgi:urease